MLPSDNEAAARQASEMFTDSRVVQYWDPNRVSGVAYSREVFPGAWRELLDHLPDDSPIRPHIERSAKTDPARRPMWDFAAFYPAGARWNDAPPTPESFIRQLARFRHEDGSTRAMLVTDSFAKPPVESDWFDEVRIKTASLLGGAVDDGARTGAFRDASLPPCRGAPVAAADDAPSPSPSPLISLAESTSPFRERFNAASDRPRFVAILSPTCGPCVSGAVCTACARTTTLSQRDPPIGEEQVDGGPDRPSPTKFSRTRPGPPRCAVPLPSPLRRASPCVDPSRSRPPRPWPS
jgi:hypothetical protein